ncbi:MAG: hypothetical protein DRJ64_09710, partial [Thermoprotei archaeon]
IARSSRPKFSRVDPLGGSAIALLRSQAPPGSGIAWFRHRLVQTSPGWMTNAGRQAPSLRGT